jgi:hypothetical protein
MAFVNDTSGIAKNLSPKPTAAHASELTYGYQPDWQRLS